MKLFCKKNICTFFFFLFLYYNNVEAQVLQAATVWDTLVTGHFRKDEVRKTLLYIPINIPAGITRFNMQASITDSANNVLDIGLFDERGIELGPVNGFRGWAGGVSSKQVHISKQDATPSYIPGPINKGVWNVMLVPTSIKKDGYDWKLKLSLEKAPDSLKNFIAKPSREWINNKEDWYHGDLHMHDVNSDGVYTQAKLVEFCKAAGLDFMISTNHNTNSANLNWGRYDSTILILNGEEITPFQENHWNAIGINADTWIEWRYTAASGLVNKYQEQVKNAGGLSVINHPYYEKDTIVDFRFPVEGFEAIEVWNGPWEIYDENAVAWWNDMLKRGMVKTAIGASDSHRPDSKSIIGHPQTVVHAKGLNRNDIIGGIHKGRCYIAENSGISVQLEVRSLKHKKNFATIGDTLSVYDNNKFSALCKVKGIADSSVILLISNKGIEHVFSNVNSNAELKYNIRGGGIQYIRAEIRKADRSMQALTNPIWIKNNL